MNAFIRLLYALLVAGAVVAFTGLAIFSFYQPPKPPQYPTSDYSSNQTDAEYNREQKIYTAALARHDKDEKSYQRNVTYVLLPAALLAAIVGLYLIRRRSEAIGEGLALGGVAISIYAIITASLADARILRFIAVTILLAVVLLVAHFRFSAPHTKSKHPAPPAY